MNGIFQAVGPQGFGNYSVEWAGVNPHLTRTDEVADHILCPGFIDIHIHGAFGIDFMSASSSQMESLCDKLSEIGYEIFLPTTVTASLSDVKGALSHLPNHAMIGGFHLEGPFISKKHPGAQPIEHIVDPFSAQEEWREVLEDRRLKVITLAPEIPGALDLACFLTQQGVIVSMGHTDATYEESAKGFNAGVSHTTHTYNAMRGLHHREAGAVGFALASDAIACELIYDRHHVSKAAASLLFKNKPAGGVIAVSDSTLATGMPSGEKISMWGHECVTSAGEVRLASNGALAGSAITLYDAFRNIAEDFGVESAIRTCSLNPRQALRLQRSPSKYLIMNLKFELVEIKLV